MKDKTLKKVDVALLILLPIFAMFTSLAIKTNFLVSALLFFGLPSLWLSYRTPKRVVKAILFSAIGSILLTTIDYIAALNSSWYVPTTLFPFRLMGVVPIEDVILGFLFVYTVIIFYVHFLDKGNTKPIGKNMKYFISPVIAASILVFLIHSISPDILKIRYAYLLIGIILVLLPSIAFLSFFPKLISRYIKAGSYFFALMLLFELTGLQLGYWVFPGQDFIGWVDIWGYSFPFEEFLFWIALSAISILSYFEFFDDNQK